MFIESGGRGRGDRWFYRFRGCGRLCRRRRLLRRVAGRPSGLRPAAFTGWPLTRPAIVSAHGIGDLARLDGLALLDGLDHDPRRGQRTRLFRQTATEVLHEGVVDLLAAVLAQQLTHLEDVVLVAAALVGTLLEHAGAVRRTHRATHRRTAWARSTHARPQRTWTHRTERTRATRTHRSIADSSTTRWWRELGLEFARSTSATTTRARATDWPTTFSSKLVTAMFAPWCSTAAIAIEAVQIVRL
jgi:hypothetical protein